MLGQIEKTLAQVAALHADGDCPCDCCEAVKEFAEAPTVEIPRETMVALVMRGRNEP